MNYKRSFLLVVVSALFIGFSLTSCDKNDEPDTTKIFGTITIENADTWATWADSGKVEVTVFPEFSLDPLAGWGAVPDDFFGPGVPGGTYAVGAPYNSQNPIILDYVAGQTEYEYEIELEPGTYSALALGFRHDYITDPTLKSATTNIVKKKVATARSVPRAAIALTRPPLRRRREPPSKRTMIRVIAAK